MHRPTDVPGAYRAVCAQRHMKNWCNKIGLASIEERPNDKKIGISNTKKKLP